VADGGEGTMRILVEALAGEVVHVKASDPLGRSLEAAFGLAGRDAIVEVAEASGLPLLTEAERDPERTSTGGTGELIVAARDRGVERILVAAGGSATVDGGAGAIEAIEAAGGIGESRIVVLCDVETPFEDAAAVYGPQKGAAPDAVKRLAERLDRFAAKLPRDPRGRPRTGAAGGLSGGLWAVFDAELVDGAKSVLDAIGFDRRLENAEAVVTGEGGLDAQSFQGKAVGHVVGRCLAGGVPVHAIVGRSGLSESEAAAAGLASVSVASSLPEIEGAAEQLGRSL
jgi:glycerate kinase